MTCKDCIHEEVCNAFIKSGCPYLDEEMPADAFCMAFTNKADVAPKTEWISVEDRLPTQDEYLTHHNDGLDSLKRITIAYMTDTVEYTIGCYDGYKWMNQLGNRVVKDVIAWKPFEIYQVPKMKGGEE